MKLKKYPKKSVHPSVRGFSLCLVILWTLLDFRSIEAQPFVYVTNTLSSTVSVIDASTNSVIATIPVGTNPIGIDITPDGTFAYVANNTSSDVSVISTATNTVTVPSIPVGDHPWGIKITPDGAFVYVPNTFTDNVSVIETATNTVVTTIPVGRTPFEIAFTPDGAFGYVTNANSSNVSVISTASNTVVVPSISTGFRTFDVDVTPDGAFVYVTNNDILANSVSVISTATNTIVATIPGFGTPYGIDFTPDGALAYVTSPVAGVVHVVDTASNTIVAAVPFTDAALREISITPDGTFAYAALDVSNSVAVIDIATNTILTKIPVGAFPVGVAITPSLSILSVDIDVKPGSDPNSINPRSNGVIPVAILTTDTFDATTVNPLSIEFGPSGATESHSKGHIEDADADGDLDLVLHFKTQETGIKCGDTEASVTGETFDGQAITGTDAIQTVGCSSSKKSAQAEATMPEDFVLAQNDPNPFNPETEIRFQLPQVSHVVIRIFNTLGQEIRVLSNAWYEPGYHNVHWDGKDNHGNAASSGIYLYHIRAGQFSDVKKMTLLR